MHNGPKDANRLAVPTGQNEHVLADLLPVLYSELRRLAAHYLQRERGDHTLQATALVHEAYLRLVDQDVGWANRNQFLGVAAQLMRRILVDYGRARHAAKRGGHAGKVFLDEAQAVSQGQATDVVALDGVLNRLALVDPHQAKIVELRFFGGLSVQETAAVLGISPATVKRRWSIAKAWLARELGRVKDSDA